MRTEDDLRTALTALERHAPAATRVLPGNSRRGRRRLPLPGATRWLTGITTAGALAGVVTALTLPGGAPGTIPSGGVTSPAPVTKTTLQAKILAAFSTTAHEIVYMHGTFTSAGRSPYTDPSPIVEDNWYYPWQAATGQQVRIRNLTFTTDGRLHEDSEMSFLMPAPQTISPGLVRAKGEYIFVDHVNKTWSDVKNSPLASDPPNNPALIAFYLKDTNWTARNTTLNGQAAIELTLKTNPWATYLWVDASTYLPMHSVTSFGPPGMVTNAIEDYQYLPATPANLAKLAPPIPAGFKRVFLAPVPYHPVSPSQPTITPAATVSPSGKLLIGR